MKYLTYNVITSGCIIGSLAAAILVDGGYLSVPVAGSIVLLFGLVSLISFVVNRERENAQTEENESTKLAGGVEPLRFVRFGEHEGQHKDFQEWLVNPRSLDRLLVTSGSAWVHEGPDLVVKLLVGSPLMIQETGFEPGVVDFGFVVLREHTLRHPSWSDELDEPGTLITTLKALRALKPLKPAAQTKIPTKVRQSTSDDELFATC